MSETESSGGRRRGSSTTGRTAAKTTTRHRKPVAEKSTPTPAAPSALTYQVTPDYDGVVGDLGDPFAGSEADDKSKAEQDSRLADAKAWVAGLGTSS